MIRERHQREDSVCLPRDWEVHSASRIPLLVHVILGCSQQCLPAGWRKNGRELLQQELYYVQPHGEVGGDHYGAEF